MSARRNSDFSSSKIGLILVKNTNSPCQMSNSSSVKIQDYAVKLEEWFVELFMLARRLSDGLACRSYGSLVGQGHRSLENRRDGVELH